MRALPSHLKRYTVFTNPSAPSMPEKSIEDLDAGYNFLQTQLSSPQPKQQQCIILDINISPIAQTVIVDSNA
jgi:hypothetical protein